MDYAQTAKDAGHSQIGGAVGSGQAPEISPFQAMGNAVLSNSELCARVRALADRLTGSAPTPISDAAGGKGSPAVPPVFYAVRQAADQIQAETGDAFRALDRIERMLP